MSRSPFQDSKAQFEAGFTVVETLVAVVLISLLSVLVLGALRFGVVSWQRAQETSYRMDEVVQAQTLLRRLIADMPPYFVSQPGGDGYVDFEGRSTLLRFIANPPASLDRAGRLVVSLSVERDHDRENLTITTRPELAAVREQSTLTQRTLLEDIGEAEFSYFGSKVPNAPEQWHSEWVREATLPELVRIQFRTAKDRFLPSVIVHPMVDVDVSCIYDALTRRCRGR